MRHNDSLKESIDNLRNRNKDKHYQNQINKIENDVLKLPMLRSAGQNATASDDKDGTKIIIAVYNFISNITFIDVRGNIYSKITTGEKINSLIVNNKDKVRELLKEYDNFPLFDLKFEESEYSDTKELLFKVDNGKWLHSRYMSSGMRVISELLAILTSVKKNSLVIVDELERSLHPFFLNSFIDNFNKLFNLQLVFSSNTTSILKTLRSDQIIFSHWNSEKLQSEYKKLSDSYPSIREVNNIEKM